MHTIAELHIFGRDVCAKRARKLRKRGDSVRYAASTTNGKSRYLWLPKGKFAMPNVK